MCMYVILVMDVFKYFKCLTYFWLHIWLHFVNSAVLYFTIVKGSPINFFFVLTSSEMEMCLVCLNRKRLGICHNCSNFQPDEQLLERLTMCNKNTFM